MSDHVKNIALVGAGGQVGKYIAEELIKANKFNVTAISRSDSASTLPSGLSRVDVDYNDNSTLVSALQGLDVLIITLAVTVPRDTQQKLIRAAAEAKVPWILPNEWGSDHLNPTLAKESLIGEPILATRKLITDLGVSSYVSCVCGFWYEYSLSISPLAYGFDFKNKKATFYNEGNTQISTSTWDLCGKVVAGLLQLPLTSSSGPSLNDYKNKPLYIRSFTLTQRAMLDSILRVTGDKESDWTITKKPAEKCYLDGLQTMKEGANGRLGFMHALYSRFFYEDEPGMAENKGLANDVLGLEKEDLDSCTERAVSLVEERGQFGVE